MKFANTEDAKHPFLKSIQHGDLNCRNILVASSQQDERSARELFRLIDFEKSSQQSALPDICWLSLWMLAASEHPPEPEVGDWNAMTFQFVATVLNQEGDDRFLGSFQIGIDLVKCLLGDVWELPNTYPNPVERGLLDNTIRKQFALTLCACAVAMCAYEVRRFNRAIERGASEMLTLVVMLGSGGARIFGSVRAL